MTSPVNKYKRKNIWNKVNHFIEASFVFPLLCLLRTLKIGDHYHKLSLQIEQELEHLFDYLQISICFFFRLAMRPVRRSAVLLMSLMFLFLLVFEAKNITDTHQWIVCLLHFLLAFPAGILQKPFYDHRFPKWVWTGNWPVFHCRQLV